jgi:hypothetical protein
MQYLNQFVGEEKQTNWIFLGYKTNLNLSPSKNQLFFDGDLNVLNYTKVNSKKTPLS